MVASVCNEMCEWTPHLSGISTVYVTGRQSCYVYSHSATCGKGVSSVWIWGQWSSSTWYW
jgi:hypothetical protein